MWFSQEVEQHVDYDDPVTTETRLLAGFQHEQSAVAMEMGLALAKLYLDNERHEEAQRLLAQIAPPPNSRVAMQLHRLNMEFAPEFSKKDTSAFCDQCIASQWVETAFDFYRLLLTRDEKRAAKSCLEKIAVLAMQTTHPWQAEISRQLQQLN